MRALRTFTSRAAAAPPRCRMPTPRRLPRHTNPAIWRSLSTVAYERPRAAPTTRSLSTTPTPAEPTDSPGRPVAATTRDGREPRAPAHAPCPDGSVPHGMFGGFSSAKELTDFTRVLEEYEVPTPERIEQKNQRRRFSEFSNETLAIMASIGVHGAFKERMLREIMRVDKCTYVEAYVVLARMNRQLEEGTSLHKFPYQLAIALAWGFGVVVIPLGVFDKSSALWFAEHFVHAEIPPPEEIDTIWKVGTWSWAWMEPIIGTWSFILLALQLVRANMTMIDAKPFNERIITTRADHLHQSFPQYEREITRDYSKSDPFGRDSFRVRHGYPANSVVPLNRSR